jgi:hypothetical protein
MTHDSFLRDLNKLAFDAYESKIYDLKFDVRDEYNSSDVHVVQRKSTM